MQNEKLNVPHEEVETFTGQIKEKKMGELLANFEGWDVQAIRKEAREEACKEAREEARKEVREEVRKEVRREMWEETIDKFLKALNAITVSIDIAKQQLMEQYELSEEEAAQKIEMYW